MICGDRQFIEETGQFRFCTVDLDNIRSNANHDMPDSENNVTLPHESGEWRWFTRYELIGPENKHVENTCWECNEPFPEWVHSNVMPFKATTRQWEENKAYRCQKCWELFQFIEPRINPEGEDNYLTVRKCDRCGAECDGRVQVCECGDDCTYPPVV